ncbi:helix-turn-helix domain-containing protein [Frankia sp. CNm7]|uniref:Helix-turn-helix domain-containing protein n=1 Tax=Frankia nepalensis TaxID=1836974 RepID=A0A937RFL3_9ACTN|nr:IclR family transcriptional regulator C-terminal domain-containing protein [Frankia nepalensis]MBL7502126.1 helix-turn-helix domain-containing protein [Frankia nepalensis]MBL7512907.1 helix-turn-helix domain-containing protein [Frankia nepalensis]MBL7524906.1 helix-turn-helix domain-containing protein [Frankia nepalensis]MBL7628090.1 helix-turn-helix domain-containing protein [Frankia nepalensis]
MAATTPTHPAAPRLPADAGRPAGSAVEPAGLPEDRGDPASGDRGDVVGPLERGLAVLRWLAARADSGPAVGPRPTPLADVARATGLARATVDRVVATLAADGLVRQDGRTVTLAPRLAVLGNAYLASCRIPDALTALAARLADTFDESVSVAVPDGDGVRFALQVTRRRAMAPVFRVGDLLPAERCAPGALFAAGWSATQWSAWRARVAADPGYTGFPVLWSPASHPAGTPIAAPGDVQDTLAGPDAGAVTGFAGRAAAAAADGHSIDDQLVETGLVAVAAPIRDRRPGSPAEGQTIAALSVVSHTSRHTAESLAAAVLPRLRRAAAEAERALATDAAVPAAGTEPARETAELPRETAELLRETKAELGSGYLQSMARGLAVLDAFGAAARAPTLADLARTTGLPRATVRRSLLTFDHLGYVATDGRRFRLLPRVLELGYAAVTSLPLAALAEPHLTELVAAVHESASLAVLAGDEIRYVARIQASRIMNVAITVGTRFPAYPTAIGRVLLAGLAPTELDDRLSRLPATGPTSRTITDPARLRALIAGIARDGYALVTGELEDGLQSLAVPVRDRAGRVVAAANVSMPAGRVPAEAAVARLLPPLRAAADAIEADLRIATAYRRAPTV